MRYEVLATDYDGTIAFDGQVDEPTIAALGRAKAEGLRLVLVTGRELSDLFNAFEHSDIFDRIVAENGAVLYDPATKSVEPISLRPLPRWSRCWSASPCRYPWVTPSLPPSSRTNIRFWPRSAILGLEWHVIFNKGSVMALPADVTKATGLVPALGVLGVSADRTVGVGDAENDHAFLRMCGLAVAVDNALPAVKAIADVVTAGARGAGVSELIARLLAGEFETLVRRR